MKSKYYDDKMTIQSNINRLGWQGCSSGKWVDGTILTPLGMVDVQAEPKKNGNNFTRLDFVHDGKLHIRTYSKFYTHRGISMLATRFAKQVIAEFEKNIF